MAKYRVYLSAVSSYSITVDVDDSSEDPVEDAIEKAHEENGAGVCAQCSGWRQPWALDLGETWETDAVEDSEGAEVWVTDELWRRSRD